MCRFRHLTWEYFIRSKTCRKTNWAVLRVNQVLDKISFIKLHKRFTEGLSIKYYQERPPYDRFFLFIISTYQYGSIEHEIKFILYRCEVAVSFKPNSYYLLTQYWISDQRQNQLGSRKPHAKDCSAFCGCNEILFTDWSYR